MAATTEDQRRHRTQRNPRPAIWLGAAARRWRRYLSGGLAPAVGLAGHPARVRLGFSALVVLAVETVAAATTTGFITGIGVTVACTAGLVIFFCVFLGTYSEFNIGASTSYPPVGTSQSVRYAPAGSYAFWSACQGMGPDGIARMGPGGELARVYFWAGQPGGGLPHGHRIRVLRRWFRPASYWFVPNTGDLIALKAGQPYAAACPVRSAERHIGARRPLVPMHVGDYPCPVEPSCKLAHRRSLHRTTSGRVGCPDTVRAMTYGDRELAGADTLEGLCQRGRGAGYLRALAYPVEAAEVIVNCVHHDGVGTTRSMSGDGSTRRSSWTSASTSPVCCRTSRRRSGRATTGTSRSPPKCWLGAPAEACQAR